MFKPQCTFHVFHLRRSTGSELVLTWSVNTSPQASQSHYYLWQVYRRPLSESPGKGATRALGALQAMQALHHLREAAQLVQGGEEYHLDVLVAAGEAEAREGDTEAATVFFSRASDSHPSVRFYFRCCPIFAIFVIFEPTLSSLFERYIQVYIFKYLR